MYFVDNPNIIGNEKWEAFVLAHPQGNIFQSPAMHAVTCETFGMEPFFLSLVGNKGEIKGLITAVIQKEGKGLLRLLSARAIVFGGPLVQNNDSSILNMLLNEYIERMRSRSIYSQFRLLHKLSYEVPIYDQLGFNYEDHLNIIVDLTKSEEELWKEVNQKRRNEIRRAIKEGVTFHYNDSMESLRSSYAILIEVYSRAKLPLPNFEFFLNLHRLLRPNDARLLLFNAVFQEKIIGCMVALGYKDTIYDFYAGSYSAFYNKYPNDLIPWQVFLWGRQNGYKSFDFGGAGKPNVPYPVRDYKRKFGGEMVNMGRYQKIHHPFVYRISKVGFEVYRKIRY